MTPTPASTQGHEPPGCKVARLNGYAELTGGRIAGNDRVRHMTPGSFMMGRACQRLFITPDFQLKRPFRGFQVIDHVSGSTPAGFLVEPSGPLVPDGASKPGGLDAALREPSLRIGNQCGRDARPT